MGIFLAMILRYNNNNKNNKSYNNNNNKSYNNNNKYWILDCLSWTGIWKVEL